MGIQAGPEDWALDQRKTQLIRACALDLEEEPVEGPSHEADHSGLAHGSTTFIARLRSDAYGSRLL